MPAGVGRVRPAPSGRLDRPPDTRGARAPPGVVVEEVPAGLWLRRSGAPRPTDLAFRVPVHRSAVALLVSRAGDPPLRAADVRHLLQALPESLTDRLIVIPYGDNPVADARL